MRHNLIATFAAVLVLAGCGGGQTPAAAPPATGAKVSSTHNDADVMFAQMMIAHMEQGVDMAQVAKAKSTRQDVKDFAGAVDATQRDELTTLKSWLQTWGVPTTTDHNPNAHAHHGGLPLIDENTIRNLGNLSGTEFDATYINLMNGHQGGAVEMARTELKDGSNPELKAYADRVAQSRQAQVGRLIGMVNGS
ncbi:hypothetical protein Lesp02_22200 [Lentzea sp. NBRC 105346]|uniref:DUF305 domain-containing protein n=1 Tax=Lentzea sp. NBRC 105346 TaxID=3032205 RepID=UPI00249FE726|nr:DUF305 domain-containing protein [Lentzea sp. NBRC 105346]GLZ30030.1 hypothetical protein Lesp02_22200 [Lentzea sp. NBRC 105346]